MKFYKIILEDEEFTCKHCGNKFVTITCNDYNAYEIEPCAICGSKSYRNREYGPVLGGLSLWKLGEAINQLLQEMKDD